MRHRVGRIFPTVTLALLLFFSAAALFEISAWARAGGGGSMGSRGSRSFSAPKSPAGPTTGSPGINAPGRSPIPGSPNQPSSGLFGRSPFLQGIAGGLAGGLLGGMLFGGIGHASPGGHAGGGIGLLDIAIIALLLYFAWRFFRRRQTMRAASAWSGYPGQPGTVNGPALTDYAETDPQAFTPIDEVQAGFQQLRRTDPGFDETMLKEELQDIFFGVQAAWTHQSLEEAENLLTPEMADFFERQFESMEKSGTVNRLENIAIRKVEPAEVWQESGEDYVTVLFTANLLDYTVDETGRVIAGDKLNPVKFQEFWTFCREIGSSRWKLSAINQIEETSTH